MEKPPSDMADVSNNHLGDRHVSMNSYAEANKDIMSEPCFRSHSVGACEPLEARQNCLDLDRPLSPQMLFNKSPKQVYLEQVHRPRHYHGDGSAPIFGNFLEPLTKTDWYIVPILWLPPVVYGSVYGSKNLSSPTERPLYWILGVFLWTIAEHMVHRFFFHASEGILPDHPIALALHFALHGIHHHLPRDRERLVMPPVMFLFFATPFYVIYRAICWYDYYAAITLFSGGIFGYICYDCTHYWLHQARVPACLQGLKQHHLAHHYKDPTVG